MTQSSNSSDSFINELTEIIRSNMSNEQFGVSELATEVEMSRSTLLRKIQKTTDQSASVFIRNVRLAEAQLLLRKNDMNVSEVAYAVGFNSASYFVKCYREYYGYPPGEETEQSPIPELDQSEITELKKPAWRLPAIAVGLLILMTVAFQFLDQDPVPEDDKSILVLPFQNDSPDSSNIYLINGLMEAILNNLQKVEDLRVLSRTTSEYYRNSGLSLKEIAKELDVNYIIEGSGQKQGDQILLTVQLIRGETDSHLWSEQYLRNTQDIFALQAEVAKDIAQEVEVKLAPEEIEQIERVLTTNLLAYDHYLKGVELINQETFEGIEGGIKEFKAAIEEDDQFSEAYAFIAIGRYYDDSFKGLKAYTEKINWYANKAYELDPNSSLSLSAKGLNAMHRSSYDSAMFYFEKVLEVNPNSGEAYNMLSEIHLNYLYDPRKYLEYTLRSMQIDLGAQDSTTLSFTYLHLSNALIQTGFVKLSEEFINKSLAYDPKNLFSIYVRAYIKYAQDRDFDLVEKRILSAYEIDSTRIDIIQELAKINYNVHNYEKAAYYYDKMYYIKNLYGLKLFESEDIKASYTYRQLSRTEDSEKLFEAYRSYTTQDTSDYRFLSLAAIDAMEGNIKSGIANLSEFAKADNIPYWFIMFIEDDPVIQELASDPNYKTIMEQINDNFWAQHEEIREELNDAKVIISK